MAKKPSQDDVPTQRRPAVQRRPPAPRLDDVATQKRPAVSRRRPPPAPAATGLLAPVADLLAGVPRLEVQRGPGVRDSSGNEVFGYLFKHETEAPLRIAIIEGSFLKSLLTNETSTQFELHFEVIAGAEVCAYLTVTHAEAFVEDAEGTPYYHLPVSLAAKGPLVDTNTNECLLLVPWKYDLSPRSIDRGPRPVAWLGPTAEIDDGSLFPKLPRLQLEFHDATPPYERALAAIATAVVDANLRQAEERRRRRSHRRHHHHGGWGFGDD